VATYSIDIRPRARRSLSQLDPTIRKAIAETIDVLSANPRRQVRPRSKGTGHTFGSAQATTGLSMPLTTRLALSPSRPSATDATSTSA